MKNLFSVFCILVCLNSSTQTNGDTFNMENYNFEFKDTIDFPSNISKACVPLSNQDYWNIFKKEREVEIDDKYYFHSLINNSESEQIVTLIHVTSGGTEYLYFVKINQLETASIRLAMHGEEDRSFSVLTNDTLVTHHKFMPVPTEWFDEDISEIGYYWDESHLTQTIYFIQDGNLLEVLQKKELNLSNLQLYTIEEYEDKYNQIIEKVNATLKHKQFGNLEDLRKWAMEIIETITK